MIRYCDAYWDDVDRALGCVPGLERIFGTTVLITGGTGMICSSVVEALLFCNRRRDAGIRILLAGRSRERTCRRFAGFTEGREFFFVPFDAARCGGAEAMPDPAAEYIIHGASNADPERLAGEPVETFRANVNGLDSLLRLACDERSAGRAVRLLYVSSSEVYGNRADGAAQTPYREEEYGYVDILTPRAAYPSSKRAAETLCAAYGKEYGLDTVIVRPGHIYGPSVTETDSRASAQFTRNAARGEDIVMKSAGTQLRSYCYTLDCASAILTVLLCGERGGAYNISNRDSIVTIRDVAESLARAAGTNVVVSEASERERQGYNLMTNSSLDAEKLERLGWRAVFGLEEGTKKTVAFYE